MKNLISLTFAIVLMTMGSLNAQVVPPSSACDTCSQPWGPETGLTIMNQKMSTKWDSCLYTFIYLYKTRVCNGELQVDILDINARLQSGCKKFCCLNKPDDCYNSRRAARRALANHLGPITLSKESACYMIFEVDPPQNYIDCAITPGETVDHWYAYLTCDSMACCKVTLTPLGGGPVQSEEVVSIPCNGNVPNVPASVNWKCGGITYTVPVMPGQTPDCEATCNGGTGVIHRLKPMDSMEDEEQEERLILYPNPTHDGLTIDYSTFSEGTLELKIYSIHGQLVKSMSLNKSNGQLHLNAKEFDSGQYDCHIYADQVKILSQTFIIVD